MVQNQQDVNEDIHFYDGPSESFLRKCMIAADLLYFYDFFVVGLADIDSLEHRVDFILFLSGRLSANLQCIDYQGAPNQFEYSP